MSERKKFLLRLDENLYGALERWAANDLRSVNAQIEFLLTDAVRKSGRLKTQEQTNDAEQNSGMPPSAS